MYSAYSIPVTLQRTSGLRMDGWKCIQLLYLQTDVRMSDVHFSFRMSASYLIMPIGGDK